ncbi:hypothetical protein GCM10009675_03530 [Prauserella alba]|uniref:Uncharacterized protein n=1 Tax=Prauserella alba TaxID=176898 RepID=A0ABN1V5F9_9PSEU
MSGRCRWTRSLLRRCCGGRAAILSGIAATRGVDWVAGPWPLSRSAAVAGHTALGSGGRFTVAVHIEAGDAVAGDAVAEMRRSRAGCGAGACFALYVGARHARPTSTIRDARTPSP